MKFGHLLKEWQQSAQEGGEDVPAAALLNYKRLKKLIKAQRQHKEGGEPAAAPAGTAASAEGGGGSSEEEEVPPSSRAGAQGASAAAAGAAAPAPAAAAAAAGGADAAEAGTPAAAADGEAAQAGAQPAGAAADHADGDGGAAGVAEEDREFIQALNEDLSRINTYFMEREEEAVIRLRALQDARDAAGAAAGAAAEAGGADASDEHLEQLRSEMVDFHGELVLLLHWSLINYAAVAKILKKHDKLTGSRLRAPVLASVLHQPFLSTESISQLVKQAERHVQELTALCRGGGSAGAGGAAPAPAEGSAEAGHVDPEAAALAAGGSHVAIYKRTRAALHMLNDMQETASTPSTLLPPSTANSDAVPDGKKARSMASELPQHPQQLSGSQKQQQQEQSAVVEVEAH